MNTTTLNMTTLDGGIIIKRGEGGGATINNQDKVVDITENGTTEVVADGGYTGLGKVTINTEVSGGGTDLDGEYFLAKPNGRYWKFTFSPPVSNQYVNPNSLSEEQLEALLQFCDIIGPLSVAYGAAVCTSGVPSGPELRVNGVGQAAMRMGGLQNDIYLLRDGVNPLDFSQHFPVIWKECDIKSNPSIEHPDLGGLSLNSYNLVEFLKA
jgi:hypothetical protein